MLTISYPLQYTSLAREKNKYRNLKDAFFNPQSLIF